MRSQLFRITLALAAVAVCTGSLLAAAPASAPEIDGGSLSAGLTLLAAGVLIVRSRMRSK